jgi:hypothetical protein
MMKAAAAKANKKGATESSEVFAGLKAILVEHRAKLRVLTDSPNNYSVAMASGQWRGKPLWAGCVKTGKAYTSYHLLPLYSNPELLDGISPELKRRMQGKACFNFKTVDPALFAELRKLTATGLKGFTEENLLKKMEAYRASKKR